MKLCLINVTLPDQIWINGENPESFKSSAVNEARQLPVWGKTLLISTSVGKC